MGLKSSKAGSWKSGNTIQAMNERVVGYLTTSSFIRNIVSKKRRRMIVGGYELDMSYITGRLLAMSFPAERMRAMYRNPLWQVKSVLDMRHEGHYKVFNLCIEQDYDAEHFHGRVDRFPIDDNHVPYLEMMLLFCENVHSWLSNDPKNIAVIHCMAGKGRTGLMLCAYLVYSGMSAEEALQLYAQKRTTNNIGVSIASQRRYLRYWENMVSFPKGVGNGAPHVSLPEPCRRELRRIRLYDTVKTTTVFFVVAELQEVPNEMYRPPVEVAKNFCREIKNGCESNSSPRYFLSRVGSDEDEPRVVVQMDTERAALYHNTCLDHCFNKPVQVVGDVRIIFYQKMIGTRLFYACFNTAFIQHSLLQFNVRDLDKVGLNAQSICGPAFCVELLFGPANPKHSTSTLSH